MNAVRNSMTRTEASEDMYRESASAYSFQIWPKRDVLDARDAWLRTKKPSKNVWMQPQMANQITANLFPRDSCGDEDDRKLAIHTMTTHAMKNADRICKVESVFGT